MISKLLIGSLTLCLLFSLSSCTGNRAAGSPRSYGEQAPKTNDGADKSTQTEKQTSAATEKSTNKKNKTPKSAIETSSASDEKSVLSKVSDSTEHKHEHASKAKSNSSTNFYYSTADVDDSASAVDDDIWRKFELAEEYLAMGVIANREASWEEAQYYFEKSLKILAKLDIDEDSLVTPEAVKYGRLIDNIVADYRVTLRSLGHLEEDVSSSVILERFGSLAERLEQDSLVVYKSEKPVVTYDMPIVMNDRVKKSIVYFQTVAKDAMHKYLRRSKKYTPMMKRILREYDLPDDLIYLSLIESGYNPHAYSWARAMGLWQFISSTGRMYKLNRNWWFDERKDPIKSTHAAAQFLKYLYKKFGSWELAMAAYNGGPGRVSRTIKKQKTIDFWKMKLKRQTMDYVPFIMAATVIAKNPEKYGFTDIVFEPEVTWEDYEINKCLELSVVAKAIGCSAKKLKELNPELLRKYTPPDMKKYMLHIPVGSTAKLKEVYASLPSPKETSWVRHKIRRGETISTIASRYGVSQYAILDANNLRNRSTIYAGKVLIVPVPLDREYNKSKKKSKQDYSSKNSIYSVRSGDTMWDIAKAFGTSVGALRRINYIERGSRIYVGQKLKIPSNAKNLKKNNKSAQKTYASVKSKTSEKSSAKTGSKTKSYKVRPGDTLWDIARMYGTTTAALRRGNSLGRSSRIYPGQVLRVGGSSGSDYIYHKVRRGESLSRIANNYRTTIRRILSTNNIDNPDQLRVGEKLKIYVK